MRVISHPILGEEKETEWVTIYVNGKPIQAKKGEMILAALRTCITPVEDGMTVETQEGLGEWREQT